MVTLHQLVNISKFKGRVKKHHKSIRPMLQCSPQRKAIITKVSVRTPKKPNSALRTVATGYIFVRLKPKSPFSKKLARQTRLTKPRRRKVLIHIHGEIKHSSSHTVSEHAQVLIAGGRPNDVPGVKLRPIRGKFDCNAIKGRSKRLSYYGKVK